MASSATPQATKAMAKLSLTPTSSIPTPSPSKPRPKPKKQPVADSWEDDESSASEAEAEAEPPTPSAHPSSATQDGVAAPPPTPISPSYGGQGRDTDLGNSAPWLATSSSVSAGYTYRDGRGDDGPRRPEKTDAVARRMIASALGVRAKPTEEQKAYDRAVREKERKKREEERRVEQRREEEAQRAKAAIWND